MYGYFTEHGRTFPWRETHDPYAIMVSEIMLQQTQAPRVAPKFEAFMQRFPMAQVLAEAPVAELLEYWQGLGYNRRALNLQRAAQYCLMHFGGKIPEDEGALQQLPGIGPYTAAAIRAFAHNLPAVVLETNIRRVYLHHFFEGQEGIGDEQLRPIIAATQDESSPRIWYSALMDYGTYLATVLPNPNRRSKHYTKQSKFEGSRRQVRGNILKLLLAHGGVLIRDDLFTELAVEPELLEEILLEMAREGFVRLEKENVQIA